MSALRALLERPPLVVVERGPIMVEISQGKVDLAELAGVLRNIRGDEKGCQHRNGADSSPAVSASNHILGVMGELAVAQHFGLDWDPAIGVIHADDFPDFEVRTTANWDGRLILRKPGPDVQKGHKPFILVTGPGPRFRLVGFILGREAMIERNWRTFNRRPKAWQVDQCDLRPLEELPR